MKTFFTTILAITCMIVLLWGNSHWIKKTTVSGESAETPMKSETKKLEEHAPFSNALKHTMNWPVQAQEIFKKAQKEKRPYKVLMVGSEALGDETSGWAAYTKKQLIKTYGEDNMSVEIQISETTSLGFLNEGGGEMISNTKPDMVLFEPFTLKDNGEVVIEESLKNVETVISETIEANPDTVFILMPPHPIYNATFYPKQVDALKAYADENNISYLDHWEAWPNPETEEVKEYLNVDQNQPNEDGHILWADYMIEYLISE